jgi:hypothetical protein
MAANVGSAERLMRTAPSSRPQATEEVAGTPRLVAKTPAMQQLARAEATRRRMGERSRAGCAAILGIGFCRWPALRCFENLAHAWGRIFYMSRAWVTGSQSMAVKI